METQKPPFAKSMKLEEKTAVASPPPQPEPPLVITEKLLSLGKKARSGLKFKKPVDLIVIHWIGPYPNQKPDNARTWWEKGNDGSGVQASAHFILNDTEIMQSLPLDEVGWHSGDERNYHSIGIEVCPMNVEGQFSAATIENLRKVVKHIRSKFPSQTLELTRHYSGVQKKDCPRFYTPHVENGENRWEELKAFLNS